MSLVVLRSPRSPTLPSLRLAPVTRQVHSDDHFLGPHRKVAPIGAALESAFLHHPGCVSRYPCPYPRQTPRHFLASFRPQVCTRNLHEPRRAADTQVDTVKRPAKCHKVNLFVSHCSVQRFSTS